MIIDLDHPLGDGRRLTVSGLEVADGEHLVVFGPNGAGKTTLLRLLAGTLPGGSRLTTAYLPQRPVALRGTARRNLELGLDDDARPRARRLACELGVDHLLGARARSLSGGERQRLALARTLARGEHVVLLDEPLAAIDLADRRRVAAVIDRSLAGRTAVVVTHDRETAAAFGDRVAVLTDGSIRQVASPAEVFALPASAEVVEAVGIANVLRGEIVETDGTLTALAVGPLVVWGMGEGDGIGRAVFGGEAVTVFAGPGDHSSSARNTWTGTVTEVRTVGSLVELVVDCGATVVALVTPGAIASLGLASGDQATLAVKATAVSIL